MAIFPGANPDWTPIGWQALTPASSTALTIPALPAGLNAKGVYYVAHLYAQGSIGYIRTDGQAAVASNTGGVAMNPGDYRTIYGLPNLRLVRVISAAGNFVAEYYYYRAGPGQAS